MKFKKNDSLIIIGAGVSGLLSAAILSKYFNKITVFEKCAYEIYLKQIEARDRHAHVCVAGALEKYFDLLPEFRNSLEKNGFFIGDPGVDIRWSTVLTSLPKVVTESTSGYGSYKLFWQALSDVVKTKENVEVIYNVKNIKISNESENLSYQVNSFVCTTTYDLLLVANGSPGRENTFLADNNLDYQTHIFNGYCCYHSLDIQLKVPLSQDFSFISEAQPGVKDLSMLYVPRTRTEGILTIGNFGKPLHIETIDDLSEALKPWLKLMPTDFIAKLSNISKQTDFRSTEIWWHKLTNKSESKVFLIGDSLLRVPPYTGLGLAVSVESLESLMEHITLSQAGYHSDYNEIFRRKANEIFIRLRRYEQQWGKQITHENKIGHSIRFSISKFLAHKVSEFIFNEAQLKKSPIAAKFLIRRFHLAQDSNIFGLLGRLTQIIFTNIKQSFGRTHEKLSKTPQ